LFDFVLVLVLVAVFVDPLPAGTVTVITVVGRDVGRLFRCRGAGARGKPGLATITISGSTTGLTCGAGTTSGMTGLTCGAGTTSGMTGLTCATTTTGTPGVTGEFDGWTFVRMRPLTCNAEEMEGDAPGRATEMEAGARPVDGDAAAPENETEGEVTNDVDADPPIEGAGDVAFGADVPIEGAGDVTFGETRVKVTIWMFVVTVEF